MAITNSSVLDVFSFSAEAALARIGSHSPDVQKMRAQVRSETLLMRLYDVRLPQHQSPPSSLSRDGPSVALLQSHSPWLLMRFKPLSVYGDGNCLLRALSLSVFGSETHHIMLQLLCVIEALGNQALYDSSNPDFYGPFRADPWLQLLTYSEFVTTLVQANTYCDMLAILAASTVLQKAVQTLWPLMVNPGELSPFSKLIMGRGVGTCKHPVYIMWSTARYANLKQIPEINHFVPLVEVCMAPTSVIDCDASEPEQDQDDEVVENSDNRPTVPVAGDTGDPEVTSPASPVSDAQPASGWYTLADKNLSLADCLEILTNAHEYEMLQAVPSGVKENVYFVISNAENEERLLKGLKRVFYDDCGAWAHVSGSNTVVVGDNPKEMYERQNLICDRKRVNGKECLIPIEPQPDPSSVKKVTRYFSKLKRCPTYTKRVTVLSGSTAYLCEYFGKFPTDVSAHGNSTDDGSEYVRTHPEVMQSIRQQCLSGNVKPSHIHTRMVVGSDDDTTCPRNLKQVQNVSVAVNAQLIDSKQRGTSNLADEVMTLCSQVAESKFVRHVTFMSEHAPCVVVYTNEQLSDVKRVCGANAPDNVRSVLCVDRTFNVSSLFLTLTVFKNRSVVRRNTMQPPIFLGPMFLHGDGSFLTYLTFFMFLRGVLDTDLHAAELKLTEGLITGSDEESALVKAIRTAFPQSKHLFCMLHCQDNVRDHLSKAGVDIKTREEMLQLLFGADGLAVSGDELIFDDRRAAVQQYMNMYCPQVEDYILDRTIPKLLTNCQTCG